MVVIKFYYRYPYLIRFSFNTYSLWRIFVQMMKFYQWTNIVMIRDCCDYPKNVSTRGKLAFAFDNHSEFNCSRFRIFHVYSMIKKNLTDLQLSVFVGFVNILADNNLAPYDITFKTGSMNSTTIIERYLKDASKYGRSNPICDA